MDEWLARKYIPPEKLESKCLSIKEKGKALVTLNGSFDLLHAGHLYILHEAKKQGDALLVALNSDASIRRYKSPSRPIISLVHRLSMVAAMECVDFVTYFEEDNPIELIRKIRPHVHANGKEYGADCVEAEAVKEVGARLYLIDRIPTLSTSALIDRILTCAS